MNLDTAYFTENNKKIIFGLLFTPKTLFICLFVLFMSHEQCNRLWLKNKNKNKKRLKRKMHRE